MEFSDLDRVAFSWIYFWRVWVWLRLEVISYHIYYFKWHFQDRNNSCVDEKNIYCHARFVIWLKFFYCWAWVRLQFDVNFQNRVGSQTEWNNFVFFRERCCLMVLLCSVRIGFSVVLKWNFFSLGRDAYWRILISLS